MTYTDVYKSENHKYGITGFAIRSKKICIYVIPKYTNYGGNHQTIAFKYLAKQKALVVVAQKTKVKRAQDRDKREISVEIYKEIEVTPKPVKIKLDINTNSAKGPEKQS